MTQHQRFRESAGGRTELNYAKQGYYRTDDQTTLHIFPWLHCAESSKLNIYDPCCGEGIVLSDLAVHLTNQSAQVTTYGVELDQNRAQTSRNILNPPYGETSKNENGDKERFTHQFFQRNIGYLHSKGILVLLIPRGDLTSGFSQALSRFANVRVFQASVDTYNQILIIAQNVPSRGTQKANLDLSKHLREIGEGKPVPTIDESTPDYQFIIPTTKQPDFRVNTISIDDVHHLASTHKNKDTLLEDLLREETKIPRPLTRVTDGHVATSLIPSGCINGKLQHQGKTLHIQGSTYRELITNVRQEEGISSDGTPYVNTFHHTKDLTQSEITTLREDENGEYHLCRIGRAFSDSKEKIAEIDSALERSKVKGVHIPAALLKSATQANENHKNLIQISISKMVVNSNRLELPQERLENYNDVKKVLLKAGGKYKKNGFEFDENAGPVQARLVAGEKINDKKTYQFFPTPEALANDIVEQANIQPTDRVLEPSAGHGALLDAIGQYDSAEVVAVELFEKNVNELKAKGYDPTHADFLTLSEEGIGTFDKIIANPPFNKGQSIEHIQHMYSFLNEGGTLISVADAGLKYNSQHKHLSFRAWLEEVGGTMTRLPENSFKESGTCVQTVLITIKK